jgi:hypothetical protein
MLGATIVSLLLAVIFNAKGYNNGSIYKVVLIVAGSQTYLNGLILILNL